MSPEATTEVPRTTNAVADGSPAQTPAPAAAPKESAAGSISQEEMDSLMAQAMNETGQGGPKRVDFPEIGGSGPVDATRCDPDRNIELLRDVALKVKVELGRGRMFLRDVIRLSEGSVVELDKLAGDPLDIYVNEKLVGKGEVLVLNENFCVRITQVFTPEECLRIRGPS